MKYGSKTIVTFVAIFSFLTLSTNALMDEAILEFLEELRMRMCHPIPKLGLPALDPLDIKHAETSMDNKYIVDFSGSITNFRLTGLSDFDVKNLKITTIPTRRSSIEVVMPLTVLNSSYTAKGSIARIVNLNGDGTAEGHVDNIRVSISWIFKIGLSLGIRSLRIELSIGDLWVNIEDLIEEPRVNDFVHALINEMGIELLNDLWVEAQDMGAIQYVENLVDSFLSGYTLSDILKIIAGAGSGDGDGPFDGIPPDCKAMQFKLYVNRARKLKFHLPVYQLRPFNTDKDGNTISWE